MHVVDHWRFLGTAHDEGELYELLDACAPEFDRRIYTLVKRTIDKMLPHKIVDLSRYVSSDYDSESGMAASGPPGTGRRKLN